MKRFSTFFSSVFLLLILFGCGTSVKVTDSWEADDIQDSKDDNYLVIARVDDMAGRQQFEQEIATRLREGGMNAVESYKKYPSLNILEQLNEEQIELWIASIRNEGINGIVLTVIKDERQETRTSSSGIGVGVGYYPAIYDSYGYFGDYYGSYFSPYGYRGVYLPASQRTYTSDIYQLETVAYDLKREKGKQLIAVVTTNITDPDSASQVAEKYADKIFARFE